MIKIVVGINTLTHVEQTCYANHSQWWYHQGKVNTNYQFIFNTPRRMSIDRMRNMTGKIAVENNADYLLFIDDDVVVPIDCLEKLIACDAEIAAGWTLVRGYPFKNMFFKFQDGINIRNGNPEKKLDNWQDPITGEDGFFHVDAIGFSCCLIKVELLKKMGTPYFVTGPFNTEDIYFCMQAKEMFPETKIVVHPDVVTPHAVGVEFVDIYNRDAYRRYFEEMNPDMAEQMKEPPKPEPALEFKNKKESDTTYEDILNEAIWGKPLTAPK